MRSALPVVVALLLSLGSIVPEAWQARAGAAFKQENTPDNLQALLQHVFRKFHVDKNRQDGIALFQSLMPDERRLRLALKDDLEAGALEKILEQHKRFAAVPDDFTLGRPEQTEVQVHGATTDQIKAYREGTIAFAEFPGGARQMAERVLRPGMTFYEVEFLEPGQTSGITYHLFYWDGQQWTMLGPIWRVFM